MEDIISFLRNCIVSFVFNDNEFSIDKLYVALLDKDNKALNIELNNPDNICINNDNVEMKDQLTELLLNNDYNIFYRILIILMITSDYYEYMKFSEEENECIDFLDNSDITFKDIIKKFITDSEFAFEILTVSSEYSKDMESILTTACIDNILGNKHLTEQIIRINPYILLEYKNKKNMMKDFDKEDIISFYFSKAYREIVDDKTSEIIEELKLYSCIDDELPIFVELDDDDFCDVDNEFSQSIDNNFSNLGEKDRGKAYSALQFMIYNILYEGVRDFNNLSEINSIYELVVNLEPKDIVNKFFHNEDYRNIILEYYRNSILFTCIDIDFSFVFPSQKRVLDLLEKFNPYGEEFDDEIYHETNENLINIMYEEIYESCLGNNKKIIKILQYMICDVLTEMSKDYNEINNVFTMLKNISNPSDLVKEFVYNSEFTNLILNYYKKIMLNGEKKDSGVLFITQLKTLKKIRKYNPYAKESEDDEDD